jgi:methylmalonyl-CoA mutase
MKMQVSLSAENGISAKEAWEKQVRKELKGNTDKLNAWKISPELRLEAYLTKEECNDERIHEVQLCQKQTPGWLNMPFISRTDFGSIQSAVENALEQGADAILLNAPQTDILQSGELLHFLISNKKAVYFQTAEFSENLLSEIFKNTPPDFRGGILFDPLANWMRTGTHFSGAFECIASILNSSEHKDHFRPFTIESQVFHYSGATVVQELAYLIGSAVTYLDYLTDAGISAQNVFSKMCFSIPTGTQYLTEIAKFRALRYLLLKIGRAYDLPDQQCNVFIYATTSSFYYPEKSPHNNIIRATSEAMSAVSGGCNALTVLPFDYCSGQFHELSDRIARNVSNILAHESLFNQVADPAAGSYLLESMTLKLADAAWELFLETEDKGGLIHCFENGLIQNELEKSLNEQIEAFKKEKVQVGVNKFEELESSRSNIQHEDKVTAEKTGNGLRLLNDKNLSQLIRP